MLALALGGRTVAEWQAVMTQREFDAWGQFYRRWPFDDFHRFHRPAAMVAHAMAGGDVQARLDWLQPDPRSDGMDDADMNTLRAFGFRTRAG